MSSIDYFNNNISTSGNLVANSGNFNYLTINNSGIVLGNGQSNFTAKWISIST